MRNAIVLYIALIFAITIACTSRPVTSVAESAKPAAQPIDPATAGSISGVVRYEGAAPKLASIDMSADPACKSAAQTETLVVSNGAVANTFVYVKDGLAELTFSPPADGVTIEQRGCRYIPHVAGVMTGQTVRFVNADPATHNVYAMTAANRQWNESQMPGQAPLVKTFTRKELMLPIRCNQHPWMRMYLNVVDHPFFAVTGPDGRYELKGLPPGTYTVAVVQEKLGELLQQVTIGPREAKQVEFLYRAEPASAAR